MVPNIDQNQSFAANSEIQAVIDWLLSQNLPPLPVAPRQNPREYPKLFKADPAKQIWEHSPLDSKLQPIPLFTGKNPSFLDRHGVPHFINHRQYQSKLPSRSDLRKWFTNSANGIGTLGGHSGFIWLDFDVKNFTSQDDCDCAVLKFLEHSGLQATFIGRTHSGGWRIGVRVKQEPKFTNFTLTPSGDHVGEALGRGRFTVLLGTGPSGNPYQITNLTFPVAVESLEAIGVYPTKVSKQERKVEQPTLASPLSLIPSAIPLDMLLIDQARAILGGDNPTGDRSESLTILIREAFGWENWVRDNDVLIRDNTEALVHAAGAALGIDSDRVVRILKTVDPASCHPAAAYRGDESSCWLKIRRLDKATYEARCPQFIKDTIARQSSQSGNKFVLNDEHSNTKELSQKPKFEEVSLRERVLEILNRHLSPSQQKEAFMGLDRATKCGLRAIENLATLIEQEQSQQESLADDSTQFEKLIEYQAKKLDIYSIFPEPLAKGLISKATSDRIDPVRLVQNLLPAAGGILGSKVGIVAKEGETQDDHWVERPVLWCLDVGSPSSGKSNANNTIFEPIKRLQTEEAKRYKDACEELKKVQQSWESKSFEQKEKLKDSQQNPEVFNAEVVGTKRKWLFDIAEMEAVLRKLAEQPPTAGATWNKDELGGLFSGLDQYKSGNKGNARQILLSAWNGRIRIDVDRVKEQDSYSLEGQTLNIAGGMQLAVARDFFKSRRKDGDPDPDGLQSRILPAVPEIPDDFDKWNDLKVSIDKPLTETYAKLDKIPSETLVYFDTQAKEVWKQQWEKFKRGYLNYLDTNPAFAYFLGKMPSHLVRLALVLHCIEHCFAPKQDFSKLGVETLERAVELSLFYIGQFRLLQATTQDEEGHLDGVLLKVWNKAQKKGGRLSASDAQRELRSLKLKAPAFKEIFRSIVERGYGYLEDEGRTFVAAKKVDQVDQPVDHGSTGKQPANTRVQPKVDQVDHIDHIAPKNTLSLVDEEGNAPGADHSISETWDTSPPCEEDQLDQLIDQSLTSQHFGEVDHGSTVDQLDQLEAEQNTTADKCQQPLPPADAITPTQQQQSMVDPPSTLESTEAPTVEPEKTDAIITDQQQQTALPSCKTYCVAEVSEEPLKVGDHVTWDKCPGIIENMKPFKIRSIEENTAWLDYYGPSVPLAELRRFE